MSVDPFKVFLDLQIGLPRNGPGSDQSTHLAYERAPKPASEAIDILVLGCGAGSEVMALLEFPETRVTAVDMLKPLISELEKKADAVPNIANRLRIVCEDYEHLTAPENTFDLIWSESSIYALGRIKALTLWQKHLKPGGVFVFSDAVWTTQTPSAEAKEFWDREYPAMKSEDETVRELEEAGFPVEAHWPLPKEDWWHSYYEPMATRLKERGPELQRMGEEARGVLADFQQEVQLFTRHGDEYGYAFFVVQQKEE